MLQGHGGGGDNRKHDKDKHSKSFQRFQNKSSTNNKSCEEWYYLCWSSTMVAPKDNAVHVSTPHMHQKLIDDALLSLRKLTPLWMLHTNHPLSQGHPRILRPRVFGWEKNDSIVDTCSIMHPQEKSGLGICNITWHLQSTYNQINWRRPTLSYEVDLVKY